jgi:hypothetical protein
VKRSAVLGQSLEREKDALEAAFEEWGRAGTEADGTARD